MLNCEFRKALLLGFFGELLEGVPPSMSTTSGISVYRIRRFSSNGPWPFAPILYFLMCGLNRARNKSRLGRGDCEGANVLLRGVWVVSHFTWPLRTEDLEIAQFRFVLLLTELAISPVPCLFCFFLELPSFL